VLSHAAALLARPGQVVVVPGDMRAPRDILASPALTALIDTSQPLCVVVALALDFIAPSRAAGVMAELRDAMPAGSFLVLSVGIDQDPDLARDWAQAYKPVARLYRHTREQVAGYFAGLELAEPGMTEARYWRSGQSRAAGETRRADILAVVGRKAP
jgi:hypothetical protein